MCGCTSTLLPAPQRFRFLFSGAAHCPPTAGKQRRCHGAGLRFRADGAARPLLHFFPPRRTTPLSVWGGRECLFGRQPRSLPLCEWCAPPRRLRRADATTAREGALSAPTAGPGGFRERVRLTLDYDSATTRRLSVAETRSPASGSRVQPFRFPASRACVLPRAVLPACAHSPGHLPRTCFVPACARAACVQLAPKSRPHLHSLQLDEFWQLTPSLSK